MAERNRAFSGVRAKLFFEGTREAGWATGISGNVTNQLARVDVLGDHRSQSIEPVGMTVSFTVDFVRILKKTLKEMGIRVQGETTASFVDMPPMTVEVYDAVGDKAKYRIKGAVFETLNFRLDRAGVMTTNASFQAIDFEEVAS